MMKNILIIIVTLISVISSDTNFLSSDELRDLILKHIQQKISNAELKQIESTMQAIKPIWGSIENTKNPPKTGINSRCIVCRGALAALFLAVQEGLPDEDIIKTAVFLCHLATDTPRVCNGLAYQYYMEPEAESLTYCALILQNNQNNPCPHEDKRLEWTIELPPKANQQNKVVQYEQSNLTIALITDAHIDPLYEPNSIANCDEPICCRRGQILGKSQKKTKLAGYWGAYTTCDTPIWAYEDVLKRIASHKDVNIVYYIGDNIDHHIWETTDETNDAIHKLVVNKIMEHLGKNILVLPVVGNHEPRTANQFAPPSVQEEGLNTTWLYRSLAENWKHYLNDEAVTSMSKDGQFSMLIRPGLRVISLNINVAYKFNWWLVYDPLNMKRHLQWLIYELYKAELSGEKAHVLYHIPPGDSDLIYTWTREYQKVVERFSSTIAAQFTAHTHLDDMKLFLSEAKKKPIGLAWGAGSITTQGDRGPNRNYKIVTLDKQYVPQSIKSYTYNLTEANLTPYKPPHWVQSYDMKSVYELQNLTPNSTNNLTYEMVTYKKRLLNVYEKFLSKSSDVTSPCDVECKLEELCKVVTTVLWERNRCEELKMIYYS